MRFKNYLPIFVIPLLLLACGEPADTRPGQPVAHRRAAFSQMLKPFEAMGVQLRKDQYKATDFLALSQQFAVAKEVPWQYFTADTNYPPTRATPKVWSEAERFDADRQAFFKTASVLQQAAETGDEKAIRAAYEAVHDRCRHCHKTFKE